MRKLKRRTVMAKISVKAQKHFKKVREHTAMATPEQVDELIELFHHYKREHLLKTGAIKASLYPVPNKEVKKRAPAFGHEHTPGDDGFCTYCGNKTSKP